MCTCAHSVSSVQSLSRVWLFTTPWIVARQASLSITNSRSSLKPCPLSWWCHPAISSSVVPFSPCPQSLPASGSFPMSQLFVWGGQSIGVSAASVSCVQIFVTPWTVACQGPWPMKFSRQGLLEQVAISFARGSSQPRGWTSVSCISFRGFFTSWTTREAQRIEITKRISIDKIQIWSKAETLQHSSVFWSIDE